MSGEEAAKVQRLIEFLQAEFPGSAPIPEPRVLEALKTNGGSQDGAYIELMEEQNRSRWEVTAPKSKKKLQQDRNNATSGPNSSAPSNMIAGRGRGGRGRGTDREGGGARDGGFRDNRDAGHFDDKNNRGGMSRGMSRGTGVRGGRGGGRGAPLDAPGGIAAPAPMSQAIDAAPKAPPAQQQAVAPPQPAAAPSVPRDAPPVVHNQWSQGRPKTQEELPKPPPEKPAVKQQVPGPAAWNGTQQAKPQVQASAAAETSQAAMKPVVQATSMPTAAPAPVQAQQQVPSTSGQQSAISTNSGGAATQAQPSAASQFDQISSMSQNLSHLGLSDANGQMQGMHKSPQKGGMPEQAVGATNATTALQQDTMSHDYSAQFAAPNAANAQQYSQQSSLTQFQYQQQAPMAGSEQAQTGDALYNDPSKMQGMGGYGQLDASSFGGMGGDSNKGYGHSNNYGGNGGGKGYGGKGANAAGNNAAGNNMPMQNWQQQQQNNMMGTWAPNPYMNYNMANMPNMNNFNMAMYMQQAAAAGQYGGYPNMNMFQSMPNTQAGGLGGNTGSGGGGGGGGKNFQQKKGGGGGGYNNNQGSNYSASNYSNYAADPNSNATSQDKYGGGAAGYNAPYYNNMNFPQPSYDTSMGSMGFNQQGAQGFSNMGGRTSGASNAATGMNNSNMGMDPQSSMMGYTAPNYPATGGYAAFQQGSNVQQGGWESQPN